MKKVSLMYNPKFVLIISLLGFLGIVNSLLRNFAFLQWYLISAVVVLPILICQKKYMENNIATYVLLATKSLKSTQALKEKLPPKGFVFSICIVILFILNIISKIPFVITLIASMIILYPTYKKIYLKAQDGS